MKFTSLPRIAFVVSAAILLHYDAKAISTVDLGSASSFGVLAGAGITINGAATITGDIGTFPTTTIAGLANVTFNGGGMNHGGDAVTQSAKSALATAYTDAAGRVPATTVYPPASDLGGLTLAPGIYNDSSSFAITGTLTLDAGGDPNAVWIFQAGSTLTTAANNSTVALINGALASRVFWQVGSSATLGTDTDFVGSILALADITLDTGSTVVGRVLAQGAVTLDGANTITVPTGSTPPGVPDSGSTLLLLGPGLGTLFALRRRFFCPA